MKNYKIVITTVIQDRKSLIHALDLMLDDVCLKHLPQHMPHQGTGHCTEITCEENDTIWIDDPKKK